MSATVVARTGKYVQPILSDGTPAATSDPNLGVYTLAVGTYYLDLKDPDATCLSTHFQWSAALVGVITFWTGDFSAVHAPLISTTSGDWIQEDPSTAYVPITGTGATVANLTITLAGGGIGGGSRVNISALAASRVRARIVVTTGGTLRTAKFGKD